MPWLTLLKFIPLPKLTAKQWAWVAGAAILIGILLGSHFAMYKWGVNKTEAAVAEEALRLQNKVTQLEDALREFSTVTVIEYLGEIDQQDIEISDLQEKLEHALNNSNECPRTFDPANPDPAIGVWIDAIENNGLPPSADKPIAIDGGNPAP